MLLLVHLASKRSFQQIQTFLWNSGTHYFGIENQDRDLSGNVFLLNSAVKMILSMLCSKSESKTHRIQNLKLVEKDKKKTQMTNVCQFPSH